jgi:hypothetical protein
VRPVDEEFARGFHRSLAHAFDNHYLLTLQLDQDRYFAAKGKVGKLDYRSGEDGRDTRVDGVAAALENSESGFD